MNPLEHATPLDAQTGLTAANTCELEPLADMLTEMGEDDLDDYEGTKLVVDGDLVVDGNLDLGTDDVSVLIVRGNLVVEGYFRDRSDDGPTLTVIQGDLRAKNAITAGLLEVHGNMRVTEAIVGDYNHGGALVRGTLTADLLMPVEIPYEVRGEIDVQESLPAFQVRLESPPRRLAPRFYQADSSGKTQLFAGEAGDGFKQAIERGESILVEGS